ncbi:MAG: hypothetical protein FJ347_02600 [Sphingomonadales bacterium]|nr:hypothetical protein [Sphingomonadales bacterium]
MRLLLLIVFLCFGRLSAQTLTAGAEYSNFTWEKLNNGVINGKGWGRGLVCMLSRDLKPSLEAGISFSAGEYIENVTAQTAWGVAPYGRLQGQLLWSPVVALGKQNSRFNVKITGGYSACYVPVFAELGYRKVHADVSVGLRQTLQMGKYTGIFADVSHHQRMGADFKTMLGVRFGVLLRY